MRQYDDYRYANAWGARKDAFNRMRGFNTLEAQVACTETAIELAADAHNDGEKDKFLTIALEGAERVRDVMGYSQAFSDTRLQAARLLPNIPAIVSLKVLQERPNLRQLQRAFELHRQELTATFATAKETVPAAQKPIMEGVVAESFVLLSLQRYALNNHQDMSWIPLPAIGHENSTGAHGAVYQPTWDISVFTALEADEHPVLSYKTQVKRSQGSLYKKVYTDDITLVYAMENLALINEKGYESRPYVSINRLMKDVVPEADSNQLTRWDARTEKILDILG